MLIDDNNAVKISAEQKPEQEQKDIILQIKIAVDGRMEWTIPQDLRTASYMLKVLEVAIGKVIEISIASRQQRRHGLMSKIFK